MLQLNAAEIRGLTHFLRCAIVVAAKLAAGAEAANHCKDSVVAVDQIAMFVVGVPCLYSLYILYPFTPSGVNSSLGGYMHCR